MPNEFTKQPGDNLDYDFKFLQWLTSNGATDTLQASTTTSTVTVPAGLTAGTKQHNTTEGIVKQWLSGGTDGADYKITCQITSTQGRVKETEITIHVREF